MIARGLDWVLTGWRGGGLLALLVLVLLLLPLALDATSYLLHLLFTVRTD